MSRHKLRWVEEVAASQGLHQAAFDADIASYRQRLQALEEQRCAERVPGDPSDVLLPVGVHSIVAVTRATGQEGTAVVRDLATSHRLAGVVVCPLVRNPASAKACALAALPPQVGQYVCDSTIAAPLCCAIAGMHAVHPCTTLNSAHALSWGMPWDGGAFAEAAQGLADPQHVVYGTARVWKRRMPTPSTHLFGSLVFSRGTRTGAPTV